MRISRTARVVLGCVTAAGLAIVYVPLLLVLLNSVNTDRSFGWPPSGLTCSAAALRLAPGPWRRPAARRAIWRRPSTTATA
ncbi:hypothetical protein SANTM175S_03802 [Streptomyces antimycoticus]